MNQLIPLFVAIAIGFGMGAIFITQVAFAVLIFRHWQAPDYVRYVALGLEVFLGLLGIGFTPTLILTSLESGNLVATGFEPTLAAAVCIVVVWKGLKYWTPAAATKS